MSSFISSIRFIDAVLDDEYVYITEPLYKLLRIEYRDIWCPRGGSIILSESEDCAIYTRAYRLTKELMDNKDDMIPIIDRYFPNYFPYEQKHVVMKIEQLLNKNKREREEAKEE